MSKKSLYYNSWIVLLAVTIYAIIRLISQPKFTFEAMFDLEKAKSDESFRSAMTIHGLTDQWMETFMYNDYILILAFTALFYLSIKVIVYSDRVKKRSFLGIFSLIPGFFDTLQNLLALEIVNHNGLKSHFSAYTTVVWIKWMMFIPFVILVLFALKIQILRLFKKTAAVQEEI